MKRSWPVLLIVALAAGTAVAVLEDSSVVIARADKHRGVSWTAGGKITALSIQPLVEIHANWIVQTPFGWQEGLDSPEIRMATDSRT